MILQFYSSIGTYLHSCFPFLSVNQEAGFLGCATSGQLIGVVFLSSSSSDTIMESLWVALYGLMSLLESLGQIECYSASGQDPSI